MPPASDATKLKPESAGGDLLLAVDTGGTKTAAWLVEAGPGGAVRVLGRGRSSAGNPLSVGFAQATHAIDQAIALARDDAQLSNRRISRAVLSIAGAANREMADQFIAWARTSGLAGAIAIVSDVLPVLAAGTPDCRGVALIAGTGSVAFGRAADGKSERCGGWGYLLGDEGSGYAIGRAALQQALHNLEGPTTQRPLADAVLGALNARSVTDLTRAVYGQADPRHAIAAIAPLVCTAADTGDADARAILDEAARDLARLAARAADSVGLAGSSFPLAVSGSLLVSSQRLRDRLHAELGRLKLACTLNVVKEPLEGCVRLADEKLSAALLTWHTT